MRIIESYLKFIGSGTQHKAQNIDDDYILKTPLENPNLPLKATLDMFKKHVDFMKQYPEIFVDVKMLDKHRASVQKVDIEAARKEINHLALVIRNNFSDIISVSPTFLPLAIYNSYQRIINNLESYAYKHNDKIIKKWCDFFKLLKLTFDEKFLDIHSNNIGLDKQGKIKLIDF
jgi:hypothetical protein